MQQAEAKLKEPAQDAHPVKLIDVREPWEAQKARVAGSILIPMNEFAARAHQELDPEDHLLILCKVGGRSLSVTNWLRQQGFENAQSVAGGIEAWSRQIDTSIPRY
uniref:Putative rhodanese-like protein n=1 Tax=mine drainage metagenome TaxID=410659 RepID=E6PZB5_9ZZZZ